MVIVGAGIPPVSISVATTITWIKLRRKMSQHGHIYHLLVLVLLNQGQTKEDKEYAQ